MAFASYGCFEWRHSSSMERAFSSGAEKQRKVEFSRMTVDRSQFFHPSRLPARLERFPLARIIRGHHREVGERELRL